VQAVADLDFHDNVTGDPTGTEAKSEIRETLGTVRVLTIASTALHMGFERGLARLKRQDFSAATTPVTHIASKVPAPATTSGCPRAVAAVTIAAVIPAQKPTGLAKMASDASHPLSRISSVVSQMPYASSDASPARFEAPNEG
jgi:hypothetical protein